MAYGVSVRMLRGSRPRHLLDGVYVCADTQMTLSGWLRAAAYVPADDAVLTHVTRLHAAGVLVGPAWPLRFASTTGRTQQSA
jgi:hypothetical protein